jgi:hypothetical protein
MISPVQRSVNLFAPSAPSGKPRAKAAPAPAATADAERAIRVPAIARGPGRPPMPFSGLTTRARRPCIVGIRRTGRATCVPLRMAHVNLLRRNELVGETPVPAPSPAGANCRESRNLLPQFSKSDTDHPGHCP